MFRSVWNSEMYLEFHRGVFTTQAETKKNNRQSEELLLNAEKFSSLAWLRDVQICMEQRDVSGVPSRCVYHAGGNEEKQSPKRRASPERGKIFFSCVASGCSLSIGALVVCLEEGS